MKRGLSLLKSTKQRIVFTLARCFLDLKKPQKWKLSHITTKEAFNHFHFLILNIWILKNNNCVRHFWAHKEAGSMWKRFTSKTKHISWRQGPWEHQSSGTFLTEMETACLIRLLKRENYPDLLINCSEKLLKESKFVSNTCCLLFIKSTKRAKNYHCRLFIL